MTFSDSSLLSSALDGGGCFLQAEGHRDARLWVRESSTVGAPPADYEGCLFELLPMLQYAARREELLLATAAPALFA